MNLNDVHTFVLVAKLSTITSAASSLGVPKSTVSRRLKRLEESLGVELFSRAPKKIMLTQDGRAFFERVVGLIDELHAAQRAISENKEEPTGLLRITTTEGYGQNPQFLDCLAKYMDAYPKVKIDLLLTSRVTNMVEEQIDIGLRLYTDTLPGDANTMSRRLHRITNGLYASSTYLAQMGTPKIEDLAAHRFVAFRGVAFSEKPWLYRGAPIQDKITFPKPRMHVNNTAALLQCALGGLGICILDDGGALPHVQKGELVRVLLDYEQDIAKASIVWMASKHLSIKVRTFINHAVVCLGTR